MKNLKVILIFSLIGISKLYSQSYGWVKQIDNQGRCAFTTDKNFNVYSTGAFYGTVDFDPGSGVFELTSTGSVPMQQADIFVAKYDSSGNFVWAKSMGGNGYEGGYSIDVDDNGNVFVAGEFQQTVDFDPGSGTTSLTAAGNNMFILKLDANGNLSWVKQLAVSHGLLSAGFTKKLLAVDNANQSVYVTGYFSGNVDFDPGSGIFTMSAPIISAPYGTNGFILKLGTDGSFSWAKQLGGPASIGNKISVFADKIALDANDNIHVSGTFIDTPDFDPGAGTTTISTLYTDGFGAPYNDVFVCKLDANGNFIWVKPIHGKKNKDAFTDLAVDASGNVYLTGGINDSTDFDPGSANNSLAPVWPFDPGSAASDIFLSKWDSNGDFVWAKQMGCAVPNFAAGNSIAFDEANNVYLSGYFGDFDANIDFNPGPGQNFMLATSTYDAFLVKFNSTGNFVWSKQIGGSSINNGGRTTSNFVQPIDTLGSIYVCGSFTSQCDFDPGSGNAVLTAGTTPSAFILKLFDGGMAGIQDFGKNSMTLYPNPANDFISIGNIPSGSTIKIIDPSGKIIFNRANCNEQITLDVSTLSNGVYFVQIMKSGEFVSRKFMVNR